MRKVKEIIEEIELLGKTNSAYFDLRKREKKLNKRSQVAKVFNSEIDTAVKRKRRGEEGVATVYIPD